jgi:hypothetical protein
MIRQAIAIGFALWVLNGDRPPYKRGTFDSYRDCIVAAEAQVNSLGQMSPAITSQCAPDDDDQRRENHRNDGER